MIQRYPLQWPEGWKRTQPGSRQHAKFKRVDKVQSQYVGGSEAAMKELNRAREQARLELK